MLPRLFAPVAERRLLGGKLRGPMPWVVAIMSFSIVIIAASGLALANSADVLTRAIEARYTVEIPDGGEGINTLVEAIRSVPGVSAVQTVPEKEMRATLERWLGSAAESSELPVPALVNFNVRSGADLRLVEQRVRQLAPDARIVAHRDSIRPLLRSLRLLQWVALGLVLLLSAAAAAAVVLAARGALDTHRFTIEVMHGVGATDVQVTQLFERKIAIDALVGSVAGAGAAALILALFAAGAAYAAEMSGGPVLSGGDLVLLALLPFALTALATIVARAAVLAALREAL